MAELRLILASTSKYRQQQLTDVGIPFSTKKLPVDETPRNGELPDRLALRLANAKARAVADLNKADIVLGADQVAALKTRLLHKPGTESKAIEQLSLSSGSTVSLYSAFVLYMNGKKSTEHIETIQIKFRQLSDIEIRNYVSLDKPLDCAGSFKSESRGPLLFESVQTNDPSAIIGLPLVRLSQALRDLGFNPLA